jgi:hypothetical protein
VGVLAAPEGRQVDSVVISGKRAFITEGDGYSVIDVTNADHMGRLVRVNAPARYIGLSDVYIYALGTDEIGIYDARATAEPVYISTYRSFKSIGSIWVSGSRAYLTEGQASPSIGVLDLSAPDLPFETGNIEGSGASVSARLDGDIV